MNLMEKDITGPGKENRDRFLVIAGGDGSLPTTLVMLKGRPILAEALRQKFIGFVTLPIGTACDGS